MSKRRRAARSERPYDNWADGVDIALFIIAALGVVAFLMLKR